MPQHFTESIITPRQYLDLAAGLSGPLDPAEQLIVRGSVDLSSFASRHLVRVLPPAKIEGNLVASDCACLERVSCEASGDVRLDGSAVRYLGNGFSAGGSLSANRCRRLETVEGIVISTVELEESAVVSLSKNFRCSGDLYLSDCDRLELLDCVVRGSVFANRSSVSSLGENFSCSGELHLTACENIRNIGRIKGPPTAVYLPSSGVERITSDFLCSGTLVSKENPRLVELSGTIGASATISDAPLLEKIFELKTSSSLTVSNCPALREVQFSALGPVSFHRCGMQNLSKKCISRGELSIVECPNFRGLSGEWQCDVTLVNLPALVSVGEGFMCDQDLTVKKCPALSHLSGRVRDSARLSDLESLETMGSDLQIIGDLVVDGSAAALKSLGCLVGGNATIVNAPHLESTTGMFKVGLDARFQSCPKFAILRGCVCGNTELQRGTHVKKIGADFECGGNLVISDCLPVISINCQVAGDLILRRTSVERVGPAFQSAGKITPDISGANSPHLCGEGGETPTSSAFPPPQNTPKIGKPTSLAPKAKSPSILPPTLF